MMLFRRIKILLCSACLSLIFLLLFNSVTQKLDSFRKLDIIEKQNKLSVFETDELACEKVWKQVIAKREKAFTLQIKPSKHLIEEFLEIVSENTTMCSGISNITDNPNSKLVVVLVNSAMEHFKERQLIRESWGSIREYIRENVKWNVRVAFLVAQSPYCLLSCKNIANMKDTKRQELELEKEQQKNGDLVIGSFTDTYRNNTYKQLMGFKFVLERCSQADLIVKTDDDVFVNIPLILNKRMEELRVNRGVTDMYCPLLRKFRPGRRTEHRYFVTGEEWPYNRYPDFCAGAFFVVSFEWMKMLYSVRNFGGFLWIDDTFVSGVLREVAEWEYERKAIFLNIYRQVWWNGIEDRNFCVNLSEKNVMDRRNWLPMFAQINRDGAMEYNMKCLTDVLLERNVGFKM